MLVRGVARRQELATRCALGADRSRLMRQLLTESLLLGMAAGGLGSMLAVGGAALFRRLAPPELPRADEIEVNGNVLLFVIGASVATGLLVGIVPAWFATAQPGSMLKSSSRTMTRSRGSRWLLNGLAAGSVAVSLTLLIAAALLQQSLLRVLNTDAGFDRRKLLTMTLSLPEASYVWQRNTEFCHDVIAAVRALPGIVNAAAIRGVPTQETRFEVRIAVEHAPELPIDQQPLVRIRVVSPEYFDTMGIGVIAGRTLERRDEVGEIGYAHSIVINQAMAERFWPQAQAVGQRIRIAALEGWTEIIGVVSDVRYEGLDQRAVPEMYFPDALFPQTSINLVVRTADAPESQLNAIRSAVLRVEPDALISDVQTMEQAVQKSVADRHFAALIVTAFSVVGFVLAVVGVYGVVSCSVADRRQELAVRLALGARSAHVLGHVLLQGAATSGSGVALGVLLAAIGTRLLSSLLYGIRPIDLSTYACAAALLMLTSTAATIVPAFRAIRIDPVFVLRDQ
jgi:putative ABC transport system permease protein